MNLCGDLIGEIVIEVEYNFKNTTNRELYYK